MFALPVITPDPLTCVAPHLCPGRAHVRQIQRACSLSHPVTRMSPSPTATFASNILKYCRCANNFLGEFELSALLLFYLNISLFTQLRLPKECLVYLQLCFIYHSPSMLMTDLEAFDF